MLSLLIRAYLKELMELQERHSCYVKDTLCDWKGKKNKIFMKCTDISKYCVVVLVENI